MPPKTTDPNAADDTETDSSLSEERVAQLIDTKLNAAISGHLKRALGGLDKTIADVVAKAVAGLAPKPEDRPAGDAPAAKPDPAVARLQAEIEALKKRGEEAETRERHAVLTARKDRTRAEVLTHLDAKGVKGARARAVLADLEASGALRFEEDGTPKLAVKRVRSATKGASAEELEFDDLRAGVDDWTRTDDAREFLPAPTTTPKPGTRPAAPARPGAPDRTGRPDPVSLEDAVEGLTADLARQGVDLGALLTE
jgi:hypothetical protein